MFFWGTFLKNITVSFDAEWQCQGTGHFYNNSLSDKTFIVMTFA